MKVTNTTFTMELTKQDIEIITGALNVYYKAQKDTQDNSEAYSKSRTDLISNIRTLRNSMASIINVSYMGIDA